MTAKEYVRKHNSIRKKIDALYDKMGELRDAYYKENRPYPVGTIVKVYFKDGDTLEGICGGEWELDEKTGEFRPNLFKANKEGACGKKLVYDWHKPIDHIEGICKAATCGDCLWKEKRGDKWICQLQIQMDKDGNPHAVEIKESQLACHTSKYVKWEGHTPWDATFKIKKEE